MATLQASIICSSSVNSFKEIKSNLMKTLKHHSSPKSSCKLSVGYNLLVDELLISRRNHVLPTSNTSSNYDHGNYKLNPKMINNIVIEKKTGDPEAVQEMYAILEIVSDRVEMHKNIGEQRDNWNHLLLNSVNGMTVTASIMSALGVINDGVVLGEALLPLKLSSCLLYIAATGISLVMNKIQPSQLAEEQRNASRLFKQLHEEIKTRLALGNPNSSDVDEAMRKILALDKAYPLPLLGAMLDKFPEKVEPAVWWPKDDHESKPNERRHERIGSKKANVANGWSENLEEELKEIVGVVRERDSAEYVRLSKAALRVSKALSICGPMLTGLAAIGSALIGSSSFASWPAILGVVFGALASVVNTVEHGGQVGMVFEMYRSSAGFYKHMEETIESTLKEREAGERENGELFEVKTALQLGRSLCELRDLATDHHHHHYHSSSSRLFSRVDEQGNEEFASKLF